MSLAFSEVRVGDPVGNERLSVFPLFARTEGPVEYLLSDEGIAKRVLAIQEVSEAGSVPELLVENKGDIRVLLIEGEELVGAKQNRILNTSVLVPAKRRLRLPVSCVERGRWQYRSRFFAPSGGHSPAKLRAAVVRSVSESLRARTGHRSDQGTVWKTVQTQQDRLRVRSGTAAMSDTFAACKTQTDQIQADLGYVEGAAGMAVAVGEKVVAIDLFDNPSTCEKVWDRLLRGCVLDSLEAKRSDRAPAVSSMEELLAALDHAPWQRVQAIGEGEEYRAKMNAARHAVKLCFAETVIHARVLAAAEER